MPLNRGFDFASRVEAAAEGRTVLAHLIRLHHHSSEAEWRERIAAGRILVDDRVAEESERLRSGQRLVWRRPPWLEPAAPLDFEVVHEDEHVLAVDKPAGLPTLPGAGFHESTLQHLVRRLYPDASAAHRLGRFTSGLVLFGRTAVARRGLAAMWREQRVSKHYRTLATGRPVADAFEVRTRIGPVPHALLGRIHAAHPEGRDALSCVQVLARRDGEFLAEVVIATGRPHQIRIHLAAAGHPLVGDPVYAAGGCPAEGCRALPGDPGYLLRAVEIALDHPATGARLELRAPPGRSPAPLQCEPPAQGPSLVAPQATRI